MNSLQAHTKQPRLVSLIQLLLNQGLTGGQGVDSFSRSFIYFCFCFKISFLYLLLQRTAEDILSMTGKESPVAVSNRPHSIYQYSNMAPRLLGQNCKFFKFLLSLNSQKRSEYKENITKNTSLS